MKTISTLDKKQAIEDLIVTIGEAYKTCGYRNIEGRAIMEQASDLHKLLLKYYPNITIGEIREAIERGSLKEYGDFAGLSNSNLFSFIRSYKMAASTNVVNCQYDDVVENEITHTPTISEMISSAFDLYKKTGLIVMPAQMLYGYFIDNHIEIERAEEMIEEARQRIVADMQKKETRSEFNAGMVMRFLQGLSKDSEEARNELNRMAMKIAVERKFDSIINANLDIVELMTQKEK